MNAVTQTLAKEYLESLNWRYATKKFDPSRRISDEDLSDLLEAVRLSPSSYGLQPYTILVIQDPSVRERLRPACWNQSQITEASHVLVFASRTDFDDQLIDSLSDLIQQGLRFQSGEVAVPGHFRGSDDHVAHGGHARANGQQAPSDFQEPVLNSLTVFGGVFNHGVLEGAQGFPRQKGGPVDLILSYAFDSLFQ